MHFQIVFVVKTLLRSNSSVINTGQVGIRSQDGTDVLFHGLEPMTSATRDAFENPLFASFRLICVGWVRMEQDPAQTLLPSSNYSSDPFKHLTYISWTCMAGR